MIKDNETEGTNAAFKRREDELTNFVKPCSVRSVDDAE